MATQTVELNNSKEVAATTEDFVSYVPPSGSIVKVTNFTGDGAFSQNSVIRLEWDGSPVWTIKGSATMPFEFELATTDTDGIKKFELILDNGDTGEVFLSGYCLFREST